MLKKFILPLLLLTALAGQAQTNKTVPAKKPAAATTKAPTTAPLILKNQSDSLSYAMGISVGEFLKAQGVSSMNFAVLNKAIESSLKNTPTLFDMQQANMIMERFGRSSHSRKAAAEKEKGRQFLEQNKKKAGITQTASGLQYEIITPGQGPKPTASDTVKVHYAGKLLSGKEFDSSYARGEPVTLPVGGVISGWTEALQLMPTGSKWRLYIPAALGYRDIGAGHDIPGGATLVFDVELLDITSRKAK
jgi:FKBP-type peptidyl-prolyl cis-trans isomerase FklB